jgi:transcription elongation factor GreA
VRPFAARATKEAEMSVETTPGLPAARVDARPRALLRELEHLRRVRRREVAERLRAACDLGGGAAENGELVDALQERELVEYRIGQLERRVRSAGRTGERPAPGVVGVGSRVRVEVSGEDVPRAYEIVGTLDAEPESGRLSDRSPVGRALVGLRRGDRAVVDAPGGAFTVRLLEIEA